MSRPKRIVCYAVNGAGMGHITRLLGVARWLRRIVSLLEEQPPEILFLTSSDASDMLAEAKFAAFKIPSKTVSREAGLDKLEYRRLAKHFVWQMMGVFQPDLLVVDTFPAGSFDELFQVLDGPFKKSFLYRGVKPDYAARATFRAAVGLYDTIVVPHRPESKSAEQCRASAPRNSQVFCCGEVIQFEREELPTQQSIRNELGLEADERLVYVSAGGGGDPTTEAAIRTIVEGLRDVPSLRLLIGAGPLYRGQRFSDRRVLWRESASVFRYFPGCDAAISAGGYNSFHELLFVGVPTLFFSQEKIADDQWQRIQDAESHGACLSIQRLDRHAELREKLAFLLEKATAAAFRCAARKHMLINGAAKCARDLLRPLYPHARLEWASQLLSSELVHEIDLVSGCSPDAYAEWLKPIFPQDRLDTLARHPSLEPIINQLSSAAAEELQAVLDRTSGEKLQNRIQDSLVSLLRMIRSNRTPSECKALERESCKALVVAIKRYSPLFDRSEDGWTTGVDSLLKGLTELIDRPWEISVIDVVRIFRMFPRIEEAGDMAESFQCFSDYLTQRLASAETPYAIVNHLQVLKMAQETIRRERLEPSVETVTE